MALMQYALIFYDFQLILARMGYKPGSLVAFTIITGTAICMWRGAGTSSRLMP